MVQGLQNVLDEIRSNVDVDMLLLIEGLQLPAPPIVQLEGSLLQQRLPKGIPEVEVIGVELEEQLLLVIKVKLDVQIDERSEEIIEIINHHQLNRL